MKRKWIAIVFKDVSSFSSSPLTACGLGLTSEAQLVQFCFDLSTVLVSIICTSSQPPPSRQLLNQRSIHFKSEKYHTLSLPLLQLGNSINIATIAIIIITHSLFPDPPLRYTVSFPTSSSKFPIKTLKKPKFHSYILNSKICRKESGPTDL